MKAQNKQSKKREQHRPLIFETPEEMQEAIDKYFAACDNAFEWVMTKDGPQKLPSPDPYTIEGLCVALGMSRQTLLNYSGREAFLDTVRDAKARIQANIVTGSIKGRFNAPTTIFNLKNNFGYKDQQEIAVTDKVFDVEF